MSPYDKIGVSEFGHQYGLSIVVIIARVAIVATVATVAIVARVARSGHGLL